MTLDEFAVIVQEFRREEDRLLDHKRDEYASQTGDVLENFDTLGHFLDLNRSSIALMYLAKHIQAIAKQVNNQGFHWTWTTTEGEGLKQRIADARNYLLLLAACIEEDLKEGEVTAHAGPSEAG